MKKHTIAYMTTAAAMLARNFETANIRRIPGGIPPYRVRSQRQKRRDWRRQNPHQ